MAMARNGSFAVFVGSWKLLYEETTADTIDILDSIHRMCVTETAGGQKGATATERAMYRGVNTASRVQPRFVTTVESL